MSDVENAARGRRVWAVVAVVGALAVGAAVLNHVDVFGKANADAAGAKPKTVAVRVAPVTRGELTLTAQHPGELDAEIAELSAQVSGRLLSVEVDIGDRVEKGKVLARIDVAPAQREVSEARASVRTAQASQRRAAAELKSAEVELERGKLLRKEQIISAQELDSLASRVDVLEAQIDAAEAQHLQAKARVGTLTEALRDSSLKAPFDGAVAERYLDPGALIEPQKIILRLVKAGPLRARFRVPERDLGRITTGMRFEVVTHATRDKRHAGNVTRIGAEVSRSDRTAIVEGVLESETEVLRPGMYADVHLTLGKLEGAHIVPSAAIVEKNRGEAEPELGVFVLDGDAVRWLVVKVRGRSNDRTAVEGVAPGAQVVVLGQESLKDGSRVTVPEENSK